MRTPPPLPQQPRVLGPSPAHAVGKTRVLGGHRPSYVQARVARRSAALQLVLVGAILVEVVVLGGHGALLDLAEAARARASRLHEGLIRRACTRAPRQEGKCSQSARRAWANVGSTNGAWAQFDGRSSACVRTFAHCRPILAVALRRRVGARRAVVLGRVLGTQAARLTTAILHVSRVGAALAALGPLSARVVEVAARLAHPEHAQQLVDVVRRITSKKTSKK